MANLSIDQLAEYALGLLTPSQRIAVEGELEGSSALRAELDAIHQAFAATIPANVDRPSTSGGRLALLSALDSGARYRPFLADLTRHFDLSNARVVELFHAIDDAALWEAGPMPGIFVMHFSGGPNALAGDTGFVRLPRGLQFPYHRHLGHEVNFVLEGALRDGDGTLYLPGEAIVRTKESAHEFSVPDDADALIAVVQDGFEFVQK